MALSCKQMITIFLLVLMSILVGLGGASTFVASQYGCEDQETLILPKDYLTCTAVLCAVQFGKVLLILIRLQMADLGNGANEPPFNLIIFLQLFLILLSIGLCVIGGIVMMNLTCDCLKSPVGIMILVHVVVSAIYIGLGIGATYIIIWHMYQRQNDQNDLN